MNSNPVALITAANKIDGIAFEVARQLGKNHSYDLIISGRSLSSGAEAVEKLKGEGIAVTLIELDVADPKSIQAAADSIKEGWGKLDALIHSAGLGAPPSKLAQIKESGVMFLPALETSGRDMREVFDVNVFGVVDLTNALAPLLANSPAPRVVMVSSARGSLAFASPLPAERAGAMLYNSSKAALNMVTIMFSKALPALNPNFLVNAASPGHVKTSFNNYTGIRTVEAGANVITYLATLPQSGPNGGFFGDHAPFNEEGKFGPVPW